MDPIIIWPPGMCDESPYCVEDQCASALGSGYFDCTDFLSTQMGAMECCPLAS